MQLMSSPAEQSTGRRELPLPHSWLQGPHEPVSHSTDATTRFSRKVGADTAATATGTGGGAAPATSNAFSNTSKKPSVLPSTCSSARSDWYDSDMLLMSSAGTSSSISTVTCISTTSSYSPSGSPSSSCSNRAGPCNNRTGPWMFEPPPRQTRRTLNSIWMRPGLTRSCCATATRNVPLFDEAHWWQLSASVPSLMLLPPPKMLNKDMTSCKARVTRGVAP
mmetsp:Transcript_125755/g.361551  ORF Transcript_125755/g.361551 Transcript_125755/m.361551 type:complete len:221 (+) Transcript_125755:969-1631(+)